MSETANVMVEDRPTEVVSVDWSDEYRVVVHQRRKVEDYSIEQALQLAGWLYTAAERAQEALDAHVAESYARAASVSQASGGQII